MAIYVRTPTFARNIFHPIIPIMATIEYRLSTKVQQDGKAEIMMRFFHGRSINQSTGTEIFIIPSFFEYYIDRAKSEKAGIRIPAKTETATLEEADKFGFILRSSGRLIVSNRRLRTPDVVYHEKANEKLEALTKVVLESFNAVGADAVGNGWLKNVVDRYLHPEKYEEAKVDKDFFNYTGEYLSKKRFSTPRERGFRVLFRDVARYIGYVRATDKNRKDYSFDIDQVTKSDIEDFREYLRNEKQLSERHPRLFYKLTDAYPADIKHGSKVIKEKGENAVIELMKRLRSFFAWLNEQEYTQNDPFKGVKLGTSHYGKPYYITIAERNKIAETDMATAWQEVPEEDKKLLNVSLETLIQQRDIFVFQCFVGCRVSDLMRLTSKNIIKDELQYVPDKTKNDGVQPIMAVVPLHPKAVALIDKYKGVDKLGRLFPFISSQKYNDAIKMIFTMAGITREVIIRNPTTGKYETHPINEIASSHLARRTFVGNAYLKAPDPSIVGAMSGHVDGSKSFRRYRNIEESTKRAIIDQMG